VTSTPRSGTRFANLAVLVIGVGLLVVGLGGHAPHWSPPPLPPTAVPAPRPAQSPRDGIAMPRSVPVAVTIPAIGVRARIIPLGLTPDGSIAVPSLSTPFLTSWYDLGPAPGEAGAAVLLGHVDAAGVGPAVFYRLGDLRAGDLIDVARGDGRIAVFRVSSVDVYPQYSFPAALVYGSTPRPTLRLVTCGGQFDWITHLYLDRIVVFADFAGPAPAAAPAPATAPGG